MLPSCYPHVTPFCLHPNLMLHQCYPHIAWMLLSYPPMLLPCYCILTLCYTHAIPIVPHGAPMLPQSYRHVSPMLPPCWSHHIGILMVPSWYPHVTPFCLHPNLMLHQCYPSVFYKKLNISCFVCLKPLLGVVRHTIGEFDAPSPSPPKRYDFAKAS